MTDGSCPNCGAALEPDARFCHGCGSHFNTAAAPAPWPLYPGWSHEAPPVPLGHHRALSGMAGVIAFFVAAMLLLPGVIYTVDIWTWQETWENDGRSERRVVNWDMVMAGMFTMISVGMGIAGGVACVRATRFPLALVAAVMMLASAALFPAYGWEGFSFSNYDWGLVFFPLMAAIALVLIVLALPVFATPVRGHGSPAGYGGMADEQGWREWGGR